MTDIEIDYKKLIIDYFNHVAPKDDKGLSQLLIGVDTDTEVSIDIFGKCIIREFGNFGNAHLWMRIFFVFMNNGCEGLVKKGEKLNSYLAKK